MIDQGRLSRHYLGVPDDDHDVDATALLRLPKKNCGIYSVNGPVWEKPIKMHKKMFNLTARQFYRTTPERHLSRNGPSTKRVVSIFRAQELVTGLKSKKSLGNGDVEQDDEL